MKTKTTNWDYRPYNGHPNWQLWNVSLWISGDEKSYFHIVAKSQVTLHFNLTRLSAQSY